MTTEAADYKRDFIELMLACDVLTFGDFTTKSGRQTPFFINSGNFRDGYGINRLGEFYAAALMHELSGEFDNLYGPAYKGIPLASVTAAALYREHRQNVTYTFNRKEAKDHGEGGVFVGYQYKGSERVVIIEDVITAGTSIRESVPMLQAAAPVTLAAVIVSVDRMERGRSDKSALAEIQAEFNTRAFAIVSLQEIIDYLGPDGTGYLDTQMMQRIDAYRQEYGV